MTKAMANWMWSTEDTDIQSNQRHFLWRLKTLPFQVQVNERTSTLEGLESRRAPIQTCKERSLKLGMGGVHLLSSYWLGAVRLEVRVLSPDSGV